MPTTYLPPLVLVRKTDEGIEEYRRSRLSQYEQETLSHLYASLDYLNCNDLPGVAELTKAIEALEARV